MPESFGPPKTTPLPVLFFGLQNFAISCSFREERERERETLKVSYHRDPPRKCHRRRASNFQSERVQEKWKVEDSEANVHP